MSIESNNTSNQPTTTAGLFGYAEQFNGTQYVTIPRDSSLEPQHLTMSGWMEVTTAYDWMPMFAKDYTSHSDPYYSYQLRVAFGSGPPTTAQVYAISTDASDMVSIMGGIPGTRANNGILCNATPYPNSRNQGVSPESVGPGISPRGDGLLRKRLGEARGARTSCSLAIPWS